MLLQILLSLPLWLCCSASQSEFGFSISEAGLDQLGKLGVRKGLQLLDNQPMAVDIKSRSVDDDNALGYVDLANIVNMDDISFRLNDNRFELYLHNFTFVSEANITAEVWPLPVTEETLRMHVTFKQAHLSLQAETLPTPGSNSSSYSVSVLACHFDEPEVTSRTSNYWLYDTGARLTGSMLQSNFESLICPQITQAINGISPAKKSRLVMREMIEDDGEGQVPERLLHAALLYYISDFSIRESRLTVKVALEWVVNNSSLTDSAGNATITDKYMDAFISETQSANRTDEASSASLEVYETDKGHHLKVWLESSFLTDFLALLDWDLMLINTTVPVTNPLIPDKSRRFLTTMCIVCFFNLRVDLDGKPGILMGANDTQAIDTITTVRVHMVIVNPELNRSSSFMAFSLIFHTRIEPYIEDSSLKLAVDLANVSTSLDSELSSFPPEWSFFMEDLVNGMIKNMVWSKVKGKVENITEVVGIGMSHFCGIDPESAEIHVTDGRIGLSADLTLDVFDEKKCAENFDKGEFMALIKQLKEEDPAAGGM